MKQAAIFTRIGGKLYKVRTLLRASVHLKATHWHTDAMAKYGRPALMSAAYGVELNKALAKLGAK